MSCYHPLKGIVLGINPDTGKQIIKVLPKEFDFRSESETGFEQIAIPCGKCIGCRLDYSRQWADRCLLEATQHDKVCFITLTYNDDNLPPSNGKHYEGHEIHTLRKRDFQLFMKRLRGLQKYDGVKIRFFSCGEYGESSYRPHYHAILFGIDFSDDRVFLKKSFDGHNYYISRTLQSVWPYGFSMVCDFSWQCAAYVARYVVKKRKGKDSDFYEHFDIEPEFTLMSRRPGIGRDYYEEHKLDIYTTQSIDLPTDNGGKHLLPPRYYDKLFDVEYPDVMAVIKSERRQRSMFKMVNRCICTGLEYYDILNADERSAHRKNLMLLRKEI